MCEELDTKTENDFEVGTILPNDSERGTFVIVECKGKFHNAEITTIIKYTSQFISPYEAECKLVCNGDLIRTATKYDLK